MLVIASHKGSLRPRPVESRVAEDVQADDWRRNAWATLATEYSLVPPCEYPWPAPLVRAIRRFDPLFVPVWVRRCYQLPTGGVKVMGYHAIGRYSTDAVGEGDVTPIHFKPRGRSPRLGDRPIVLSRVLDGSSLIDPETGRPGDYKKFVPFDNRVVATLRDQWRLAKESQMSHKKIGKEQARAELDRRAGIVSKAEENADQAIRDDSAMIKRAFEKGEIVDKPRERKIYGI